MRVRRRWLEVAWLAVAASAVLWADSTRVGGGVGSVAARAPSPDAARPGAARRAARAAGCTLFTDPARTSTSADCLVCHRSGGSAGQRRACHPVAIDYASASRARASLRPFEEVVRRGVSLPDRELRCVTCHDGRSPWAHAVVLPPGATPAPAVADPPARGGQTPAPGDHVDAKPLCLACHLLG